MLRKEEEEEDAVARRPVGFVLQAHLLTEIN